MAALRLESTPQSIPPSLSHFAWTTASELSPEDAEGTGGHIHVLTPNRPLIGRGRKLGLLRGWSPDQCVCEAVYFGSRSDLSSYLSSRGYRSSSGPLSCHEPAHVDPFRDPSARPISLEVR